MSPERMTDNRKYFGDYKTYTENTMSKMKKNIIPIIEIILAIIILDAINLVFFRYNPAFVNSMFNPAWIIIVLIASRYGFLAGVFSGVLVSLNMFIFVSGKIPLSLEDIEKTIESYNIFLPVFFMLAGVVIGLIRQNYIDKEYEKDILMKKLKEINKNLEEKLKSGEVVRTNLEKRVVGSKDYLSILRDIYDSISILDRDMIADKFLRLIQTYFNVSKSAIYFKDLNKENGFILKFSNGYKSDELDNDLNLDSKYIELLNNKKNIFAKDVDENFANLKNSNFLVIYPMLDINDKLLGFLKIEKMPFLYFNKSNVATIGEILKFIDFAFQKIYLYEMNLDKILEKNLDGIYNISYFKKFLEIEYKKSVDYKTDFAFANIRIEILDKADNFPKYIFIKFLVLLIKKHISYKDMIFANENTLEFSIISPFQTLERMTEIMLTIDTEYKNLAEEKSRLVYEVKNTLE
jgi:hypothetical protein